MQNIIIKENNCSINEVCGICGKTVKNTIPVGAFVEKTNQSVCGDCISEHNPLIKNVLDIYFKHSQE